jgi:aconitate hydratase
MHTLTEQLISKHLVSGEMVPGEEIGIKIDQTLIQDSTGTMADLQFEAMGVPRVKTELSVSFIDHNILQNDFKNMDDHKYLQSVAQKYGLVFSRAGNGICHQVFLERFAQPGKTLLGSDSHTTSAGAVGCLAIGAGGLDVAASMAGEPYYFNMPEIIGVKLTGNLQSYVSAKDIILEILRQLDVHGGKGCILEYFGPGINNLSIPERSTITNMGTETGATSSIFPSDNVTRRFLIAQERQESWVKLSSEPDAYYSKIISIELDKLEPLIALPHSPGNVKKVSEIEGLPVDQVCIGSCTNSSVKDLKTAAFILKDKKVNINTSLTISPGSRQVLTYLAESGDIKSLLDSGARVLECACGPCIGMGQAPCTDAVSLRTFNRNFKGRSGTKSAQVYLVSPETAAASAIYGVVIDPRKMDVPLGIDLPEKLPVNDSLIIYPSETNEKIDVIRGPNIVPLPGFSTLPPVVDGEVLIKVGDNITTDEILAGGAEVLPLRSNVPEISKYLFKNVDPTFYNRLIEVGGGIIVGGENYGQGSSREHAALSPRYLGVQVILAKSFARIHESNLVNFGIVPIIFDKESDYDLIKSGDSLKVDFSDFDNITIENLSTGKSINVNHNMTERGINILKAGGKLAYIKERSKSK